MVALTAIQILRAIAAIAVVVSHVQYDLYVHIGTTVLPDLSFGTAGVDLFFIISGFVMVYSSERMFGTRGAPAEFLRRRLIRIVPLYWAVTGVYLIIFLRFPDLVGTSLSSWFILASFLFIPAGRPNGTLQPLVAQGWTLNYEMFFYCLFVLAIRFPRRVAIPIVSVIIVALVIYGHERPPASAIIDFWLAPIMLEFVLGMLIGAAFREGVRLSLPVRLLFIVGGLGLFCSDLPTIENMHSIGWVGFPAAFVVAGAVLTTPKPYSSMFARGLSELGGASYALYLIHPVIVRVSREAATRANIPYLDHPWFYLVIVVTISACASVVVFRLFERPVTKALARAIP